ncbi:MAG TPA: hypothetical protein VHQ86_02080 [Candidatus Saccharimonadia bacterium]|jgi:hypothetical protein|nr:hypothetical protein [Candidatus Saccharimonadia bacterium]
MQYLGLIAIGITWLGGGYLLARWRGHNGMSMSQHAASARAAFWWFAAVLTVSAGLLYWFMLGWFVPRFALGPGFVGLLSVTVAGLLVAAWVPDTTGWLRRLHRWCAYGMAVLFMPLVALIVASPNVGAVARYVDAVLCAYLIGSLTLVTQFGKFKRHYLPLQVSYVVAFEAAILVATYLG